MHVTDKFKSNQSISQSCVQLTSLLNRTACCGSFSLSLSFLLFGIHSLDVLRLLSDCVFFLDERILLEFNTMAQQNG